LALYFHSALRRLLGDSRKEESSLTRIDRSPYISVYVFRPIDSSLDLYLSIPWVVRVFRKVTDLRVVFKIGSHLSVSLRSQRVLIRKDLGL
jgi:hypothetical protein